MTLFREFFKELPRCFSIFVKMSYQTNEFLVWWIFGVLSFLAATGIFNPLAWIFVAAFYLIVGGLLGIFVTIRGVEKALLLPGISFDKNYGEPKWVIDEANPCQADHILFTACGIHRDKYNDHVKQLSARLLLPVRSIEPVDDAGKFLKAVIVRRRIPDQINFTDLKLSNLNPDEFYFGSDNNGEKRGKLADVIHLLVAGQTGSGKTVYLQQVALSLLARNKSAYLVIIDMKKGIDYQGFKDLKNCELYTSTEEAHQALDRLYEINNIRSEYLKETKKRHWYLLTHTELESAKIKGIPNGPLLVLTDELAELTGYRKNSSVKESIHFRISALGRMARSTGIHLLAGTQRPDRTVIDSQTKDSFVTRVCFAMPSIAGSNTVLDNKGATTIGHQKGRAIVKYTGEQTVVQAPWLHDEDIAPLVKTINDRHKDGSSIRPVLSGIEITTELSANKEAAQEELNPDES